MHPISDNISYFFLCLSLKNKQSVQYATRGLPRPVFTMAGCHATHAEHSSEGIQGVRKLKTAKFMKTVQLATWSTGSALLADIRSV